MSKILETEIVDEEFKAPVLKDIKYPVNEIDLDILLETYSDIPKIDPESEEAPEQYQYVLKGHKAFVKARNVIEKTRKELKSPSLAYGKSVDSVAKEFQAKIQATEQALFIQRKMVEDNEQKKQDAYEESERQRRDAIRLKIDFIKNLPLDHFNSSSKEITKVLESLHSIKKDEYEEFYEDAYAIQETTISQLQTAWTNKVTSEQAEKVLAQQKEASDTEAKLLEDQRAKEREDFEAEKAEFQRQKDDLEREKKEAQEIIDLKNAEFEVEQLSKKQDEDRKTKESEVAKHYSELRDKAFAQLEQFTGTQNILNAILDDKFDNIKWVD